MGITKSSEFSDSQNQMANVFKAIGHPARVAIIEYLLKAEACVCGDIVNELPLAQATVSQHLKELKSANMIQGTIEGKSICYCINPAQVQEILNYFQGFKEQLEVRNTCC
jgi:predicted transcriptional regulator